MAFPRAFFLFLLVLFLLPDSVFAQDDVEGDLLQKNIYENIGTRESRQKEINAYIKKAKSEGNRYHLYNGYASAANNSSGSAEIKYIDSLIDIAVKNKDNRLIAMSYQASGIAQIKNGNYKKALDHLLLTLEYFDKNESKEWTYHSRLYIAEIKALIGDYAGAIQDLKTVVEYRSWKKNKSNKVVYKSDYAASILYLAKTYALAGKLPESESLIIEAEKLINTHKEMASRRELLNQTKGIYLFEKKNYKESIKSLLQNLAADRDNPHLREKFYLGMSFWKSGNMEAALPYFAEIWDNYSKNGVLPQEFRPVFEFYSDYYKSKNQHDLELKNSELLLDYDRKAEREKKELAYRLATDYDEKRLAEERCKEAADRRKERLIIASALAALAICAAGIYFYKKRNRQKSRQIPSELPVEIPAQPETAETSAAAEPPTENQIIHTENPEDEFQKYHPIHRDTVRQILEKLEEFEAKKLFLKKNIRLSELAEEFRTNEKYLSKIIRIRNDKNFNQYINDLRLAHYDEKMQNADFQKKKLKQIAEYLGYSSPEAFATILRERDSVSG